MLKIKSLATKAVIAEKLQRFPIWAGPNAGSVPVLEGIGRCFHTLAIFKQELLFFPGGKFLLLFLKMLRHSMAGHHWQP